jgi:hypothetical protein
MNSGASSLVFGRLVSQACNIRAVSWSKKSCLLVRFAVGFKTSDIILQIYVYQIQAAKLASPHSRLEEQGQDCFIPAI